MRLTLHGVDGRRAATLIDERLEPGEDRISWAPRDTGGRRLAAGVYFLRLAADGDRAHVHILVRP